ncbi:MAG TPA: hydroxymethylbilane synthase [Microbacterium sp.]|nr:hydroxymethylbilane synthase [Microbacterium sp.]
MTTATGVAVEIVPIVSEGDVTRAPLAQLGGTGVFATRLREALLAGECDLLVHSLKDLPTGEAPGLRIAAIPRRADPRDVSVTRGSLLEEIGEAIIGTGSPRRQAQLRRRAPRAQAAELRGNVDSRLGRVRDGELDGIILAAAGLTRLGLLEPAEGPTIGTGPAEGLSLTPLGLAEWPTAAGQGALALEVRDDAAADILAAITPLEDPATRFAVTIERSILAGIEAGCHAPVGIHASITGDDVRVRAVVYAVDGTQRVGLDRTESLAEGYIRRTGGGDGAYAADSADPTVRAALIGSAIARRLLDGGAADLVSRESSR